MSRSVNGHAEVLREGEERPAVGSPPFYRYLAEHKSRFVDNRANTLHSELLKVRLVEEVPFTFAAGVPPARVLQTGLSPTSQFYLKSKRPPNAVLASQSKYLSRRLVFISTR